MSTSVVESLVNLHQHAAQPDVVLSQERDSYYADTLIGESAAELSEALLGSRRATVLAPELKAFASCLYFGLTNFVGKQTLGQEYCDIALATGGGSSSLEGGEYSDVGRPLSSRKLRLYTLIRVGVPYLQERMREGWHGLSALRDQYGRGGRGAAAATLAAARARTRARAAALAPPVGIGLIASSSEGGEQSAPAAVLSDSGDPVEASGVTNDVRADGREGGESGESQVSVLTAERSDTVVGVRQQSNLRAGSGGVIHTTTVRGLSSSPPFMTKWASAFLRCLGRVLAWARRKRPEFSGVFDWLLRLHLAVFYFDGRYPSVAMRTVEARLMYTRQQDEPRARYAILGLLSLVQALGEAAVAAGARLSRNSITARVAGGGVSGGGSGGSGGAGDVDLASTRVPSVTADRTPADVALFPRSRRKCSLCMSPRQHIAATPCGHLFCWECIVGWCQTNPECPLCRQPAAPQSIVCVYQYA